MVGNRESGDVVLFGENDVAAPLAGDNPTERFENLDDFLSTERRKTRQSGHHLDFTGFYGQGQSALGSDFEAKRDGFLNVAQGLLPGSALADAAWDCRAFNDPHAVFVAIQSHLKTHPLDLPENVIAKDSTIRTSPAYDGPVQCAPK
jgi:hypothetical protein